MPVPTLADGLNSHSVNQIFLIHYTVESTNKSYCLDSWDITGNFQKILNPSRTPAVDPVLKTLLGETGLLRFIKW